LSDIGLFLVDGCFDIVIENDVLKGDEGLQTAVAISLFTDQRVTLDELPDGEDDRHGWWGDMFPEIDQDKIGSKIWTLARAKKVPLTLVQIEEFSKQALQWMIDDGLVSTVTATAEFVNDEQTKLDIEIERPDDIEAKFSVIWDAQGNLEVA